jgi:DNA-binding transcriptional LysR family regulator
MSTDTTQRRLRDLPLSLDLLRGFEAAARSLSFTTAAGELFVTQSAVSRQVQQLEEQLGVKLFERRTRALALTEAGALYYREVSRALALLREATVAVRTQLAPAVRVTTTLTFASMWLIPRLAGFQRRHEEIVVQLMADNAVRELERHSLDVAIRYCPPAMAGPEAIRLFGETVAPVCAPSLIKGRKPRTPAELLALPLIEIDDANVSSLWLSWAAWAEAVKVELPRRRRGLTCSHYDQVVQAALAGQGVALGRFPLIDPLLTERRLVLPLANRQYATPVTRAYHVLVAAAARSRPEVTAFVDWLRATAAAEVDRAAGVTPPTTARRTRSAG